MKKYILILMVFCGLGLSSCYNDFDDPQPKANYNDQTIGYVMGDNAQLITIAEMKAKFGTINNTGNNDAYESTKYLHFVKPTPTQEDGNAYVEYLKDMANGNILNYATEKEKSNGWYEEGNYYIKGKVISTDEQGNIYKSLYIFDGTAAIELKLTNGLYMDYPLNLDTKESTWVYVKLAGLYLGNFRMMLSLGDAPSESLNAYAMYKYYANSNINSPAKIREHVFIGEKCTLSEGTNEDSDIYDVDQSNYATIRAEKFLGRLIRFKGIEVMYCGVPNGGAEFTSATERGVLKQGSYDYQFPTWICTSGLMQDGTMTYVVNQPWYQLAYSIDNTSLYGSVCVGYNRNATQTGEAGVYTLRTSGFSRFSGKFVPKDGSKGDILAIYAVYGKTGKWADSDYVTYQLSACRQQDITFDMGPRDVKSVDAIAWNQYMVNGTNLYQKHIVPTMAMFQSGKYQDVALYGYLLGFKELLEFYPNDDCIALMYQISGGTIYSKELVEKIISYCKNINDLYYSSADKSLRNEALTNYLTNVFIGTMSAEEIETLIRTKLTEYWTSWKVVNTPAIASAEWADWTKWAFKTLDLSTTELTKLDPVYLPQTTSDDDSTLD